MSASHEPTGQLFVNESRSRRRDAYAHHERGRVARIESVIDEPVSCVGAVGVSVAAHRSRKHKVRSEARGIAPVRQRASQPRPSRRFRWRETPFGRWYLRRLRLVTAWWQEIQELDRASYEKLIRDMPPYIPQHSEAAAVQMISEGGAIL